MPNLDAFRARPGGYLPTMPGLSYARFDSLENILRINFAAAGLEACPLAPSSLDPCAGPRVSLKNVSKKLVVIEDGSKQNFLEPGESVMLSYSLELRATALNNGV
jgi:hypothetical protein